MLPKLDEELKPEIIHWAAFYEHRIRLGSKVIFHLEAFVAKGKRSPNEVSDCSDENYCGILDGIVLKYSQIERLNQCTIDTIHFNYRTTIDFPLYLSDLMPW